MVEVQIIATGPVGPQGEQGPQGIQGERGFTGETGPAGNDGVSPEVTVAEISGGHSVTIKDAEHPTGQSFNVMDGSTPIAEASGIVAAFDDGTVGTPEKLLVKIPYIPGGLEKIQLLTSGVNMVDHKKLRSFTSNGITATKGDDGVITLSGTSTSSSAVGIRLSSSSYVKTTRLRKGIAYRIGGNWNNVSPSSSTVRLDVRPVSAGGTVLFHENTGSWVADDDYDVYIFVRVAGSYAVPENVTFSPCLVAGPHSADYTAGYPASSFHGDVYTADWSGTATIYGGTFEAVTGVLTSTLDSNGDELETPVTYQIDPVSVAIYNGENRVWATVGSVDVVYRADITKNITSIRKRIRVCAWNVGNFALGGSGTAAGTDAMYYDFIQAFRQINADVYLFSEWDTYWNNAEQVTALTKLGKLKPYWSYYGAVDTTTYIGQKTASDYPIIYETRVMFGSSARYFLDTVMQIYGRQIHFVCTHLPFDDASVRDADVAIIQNYLKEVDAKYYVVGGDFNMGLNSNDPPATVTDYMELLDHDRDIWTDAGYNSAQGTFWGDPAVDMFIHTHQDPPTQSRPVRAYDNIVTSPNIHLLNAFAVESDASDHYPIVADLLLLD